MRDETHLKIGAILLGANAAFVITLLSTGSGWFFVNLVAAIFSGLYAFQDELFE